MGSRKVVWKVLFYSNDQDKKTAIDIWPGDYTSLRYLQIALKAVKLNYWMFSTNWYMDLSLSAERGQLNSRPKSVMT